MIEIPLTRGHIALVDEQDEHLTKWRWHARPAGHKLVYAQRTTVREGGGKRTLMLHREVLGLHPGDGQVVDHINGNPLDNRRANLRVVTTQENMRNVVVSGANGSCGFRGVCRSGASRWKALINVEGRPKHIGTFATPEEANIARLKFEKEVWGIQPRRLAAFQEAGLA